MLDFNRTEISAQPISNAINTLISLTRLPEKNTRQYLGASAIGSECIRKVQFDWMCDPVHEGRLLDVFARGHFFEDQSRRHLIRAGFKFAPPERLRFETAGELFRGHADGILLGGPELPSLIFPCIWEHKCMNAKNWRAIDRDGLVKPFPHYAAQIAIYQAYLDLPNPALVTVTNADTCDRLHLLLLFDAEHAQYWSDRAVMVIEATRAGELLPRITDDKTDWRCKMCGHFARCWK